MSVFVFGAHRIDGTPGAEWLAKPEFRRATLNMALGAALLEPLVRDLRAAHTGVRAEELGLVLQSQTGELEATVEFLRGWSQSGIARPMLFQSSLHNATGGFLAIHFGFKGPVASSSPAFFSEEQALEMGRVLLAEKQCRFCFVVSLEAWPAIKGLEGDEVRGLSYASAVVLAREPGGLNRHFDGVILEPEAAPSPSPPQWSHRSSNQNALFNWVPALLKDGAGILETAKPGEGRSRLRWSEA